MSGTPETFPIIGVTLLGDPASADPPGFTAEAAEQVGSKEKVWCEHIATRAKYLLKFARPDTGEDWAEKLGSEIAQEIFGLPRARVDLAAYQNRPAVLLEYFPQQGERLIHGNELLLERDASYPSREVRRVRKHTVGAVFDVLSAVRCPQGRVLPTGIGSAPDLFCGYLVLDTLIGNIDRHHENWGILVGRSSHGDRTLTLAPTYDHGSSLGRELLDVERERRLRGRDSRATVASYALRGQSAFYLNEEDKRPLSLRDLLKAARQLRPEAVAAWASRLAGPDVGQALQSLVGRVPSVRMSPIAKEFTSRLLAHNCATILDVVRGYE